MSNGFWDEDDYDYDDHVDDQQSDTHYDTEDIVDENKDSEDDDNDDDGADKEDDEDQETEDTDMGENSSGYSKHSIIKQQSSNSPSFHGYGKCMRYLCNCQHFESISGNTCSNCGHSYSDHW
ncbi:hypothetical protein [Clostridium sp. BNL1100]|uniref:hypothetical protein n=1 Tax=Clostridium sp. BNL1100 TaxID=755731 RepID=UPI00024A7F25|nr:hypothetical protein [Clostridium sp. BNL1100]AEY65438.1 hypothetical protein Clo1100_1187 [Clostridium sp. BNL1100]